MTTRKGRDVMFGNLIRTCIAEAVGTFFLVLVGTSVAVAAVLGRPIAGTPVGSAAVALAFGLALVALVCALGHISDAHFNPAVTIGLTLGGKFPLAYAPFYVAAQFGGALLASLAVWAMFGDEAKSKAFLGATQPATYVTDWGVLVAELLMTLLLTLVITAVATDKRAPTAIAGVAIGITLAVGVIVIGPLTGGGLNPARSFAPMLLSGKLEAWPAYLAGQIIGGVLGVFIYGLLRGAVKPAKG